jgi:hypothetical protein
MNKPSFALILLRRISFTWTLGHVPRSSFTTWADAENAIQGIAACATETIRIGYKVEWVDGEDFEAYLDVVPGMTGPPLHLQAHVRRALATTAGRFRPATMSRGAQRDFLTDQEAAEPGKASHAKALLDKHQIGEGGAS